MLTVFAAQMLDGIRKERRVMGNSSFFIILVLFGVFSVLMNSLKGLAWHWQKEMVPLLS